MINEFTKIITLPDYEQWYLLLWLFEVGGVKACNLLQTNTAKISLPSLFCWPIYEEVGVLPTHTLSTAEYTPAHVPEFHVKLMLSFTTHDKLQH